MMGIGRGRDATMEVTNGFEERDDANERICRIIRAPVVTV
jgi:hypothetical protein